MTNATVTKIPAVEDRIFEGFQAQYYNTFGCSLVITQASDAIQEIQRLAQGRPLRYPLAYAKITTIASPESPDHYVPRYLLRKGFVTATSPGGNTNVNVRILPSIITLDLTYETRSSSGEGSVAWYAKRWLMACRMGLLKFSIEIGRMRIKIGVTGDLTINIPGDRPSPSEEESGYKVQTQVQIKGYMSEIQLAQSGELVKIELDAQFGNDSEPVENWDLTNGDQP